MPTFQGTLTALITPFRDGKVDYDALDRLVERQIAAGVDGVVPCGTTGESPTLSPADHAEVIRRVIKIAHGRVAVIAGTGSNSTAEAVEYSADAAEHGADGLLVVAPYYNKPSQAGLYENYAAIAKAVDLPIVVYNIPGRCGVEISVDTLKRLYDDFANIVSVKHATGSIVGAAELMDACDVEVLSGDDPMTLPLMSMGGVGVISVLSNLAPRAVKRLTDAALAGDFASARQTHRNLFALGKALLSLDTNPVPIKTAMALKGFCTAEFRLPMVPLTDAKQSQLQALLAEHLPRLEEPDLA